MPANTTCRLGRRHLTRSLHSTKPTAVYVPTFHRTIRSLTTTFSRIIGLTGLACELLNVRWTVLTRSRRGQRLETALSVSCLLVVALGFVVVAGRLEITYRDMGVGLPWLTQVLLTISNNASLVTLAAAALAIVAVRLFLKRSRWSSPVNYGLASLAGTAFVVGAIGFLQPFIFTLP